MLYEVITYNVLFCDKKGLAIRNGGVYSQITFTKDGAPTSPLIPYGQADLLMGVDPLEAVRSLDPKGNQRVGSPSRTTAVIRITSYNVCYTKLLRR